MCVPLISQLLHAKTIHSSSSTKQISATESTAEYYFLKHLSQSDFEACAVQELLNHSSYYVGFLHTQLVIITLN
jgi:hypothetical protein